ncbi:ECF RNA polymerase sigma factor SigX [Paraliobacillus quinghaiensis]|uniref:ECF RNA polymerase sigma factor SigX n=1 Tax=Paraliobacillus quinghaiensis TaxID=470815 RepID=A0A917WWQ0_9BACI|nr:RNA polymerase sigma factor [Paraliobacillus quinghaiensis]GGM39815.1 ECF RNA polymerase sigma factor SigX [Paraliobacillus quinghaiensis]
MTNTNKVISDWFYQYSNDVYNFLVYYTGSTDVEDLVQDVFIKAGKGLKSYKKQSSPKTWILSIARNVAIDEARKKENKVSKNKKEFDEQFWIDNKQYTSPEKIILQNERHQELYKAIQQLKTNYRDVVILRGIKELSVKETAEILNWKAAKVRTNYHRALKRLGQMQGGGIFNEDQ